MKLQKITQDSIQRTVAELLRENCRAYEKLNLKVASIPYFSNWLEMSGVVKPYQKSSMLVESLYGIHITESKYMPHGVAVLLSEKEVVGVYDTSE